MPAPTPLPTYIYKIVSSDPSSLLPTGLPVSAHDLEDGFIHMSTAEQVPMTVSRFFKDVDVVYLLKVPYAKVEGKIKWDETGAGTFPHIYAEDLSRSLDQGNVENVLECRKAEGQEWEGVVEKVLGESS
jgi:uncharacterized protein (DUF952 family)